MAYCCAYCGRNKTNCTGDLQLVMVLQEVEGVFASCGKASWWNIGRKGGRWSGRRKKKWEGGGRANRGGREALCHRSSFNP